ncbi:MAG: hypothetical protein AB7G93_09000 [Bdellovibrionales bacterium]
MAPVGRILAAIAGCLSLVHCSSLKKVGSAPDLPPEVTIAFRAQNGAVTDTRYYSSSWTRGFTQDQIVRDRTEVVEFAVRSRVLAVDTSANTYRVNVRTIQKDGTVDLHALAFPELNEELEYVIRGDGAVLKAGNYPSQSIFFVPAMPVPHHPVRVGDTWTMKHSWLSAQGGIPLTLDVVGILKDIVSCDGRSVCADVEVSGHVRIEGLQTKPGGQFENRVWGRMLFGLSRGDVIWSEMRSAEEIRSEGDRVVVNSCMVSEVAIANSRRTAPSCDPKEQPVEKVPQI